MLLALYLIRPYLPSIYVTSLLSSVIERGLCMMIVQTFSNTRFVALQATAAVYRIK